MSFFDELKRRNVFRIAIAYIILSWLMAQVAELLLETFGSPDWVLKTLLALFLIGFPFALFFAWAFEMTPDGIKKERDVDRSSSITPQTGHKLDRSIIVVLVLALGYFAWDKFSSTQVSEPAQNQIAVDSGADHAGIAAIESTLPTDKSIAVLPFDNRSSQQEDEFFTSGIHDDLLTQLAQISSLRVISRTSVVQFKNTSKSIREIAELLDVATILEGGVQRAGNQVRINMQLIDAATDAHLWAQTYDRELTTNNIFAIQSEIATSVTQAMRATLTPEEQTRIADVPTQNMQALEEYFKGRAELDQRTVPALESARMRFEHARQLDSRFALALAGEALAIMLLSDSGTSYGTIPKAEAYAMARPLLEGAFKIAPLDPQVLGVFGLLEAGEENLIAALDYYQRSLALNPSSGEVMNWNRMALFADGRIKEAMDLGDRMVEIDPMSMITLFNSIVGMPNTPHEDPQKIETLLQRLYRLDASYGLSARGGVEERHGNIVAAAGYYYQALEADPGRSSNRASLAFLLARLGLKYEASRVRPDWPDGMAFFDAQWGEYLRISQQAYDKDPTSTSAIDDLMEALIFAGDTEAAFELAEELWARHGSKPSQLGSDIFIMAWLARKTEHPKEARRYRDAAATMTQAIVEAGWTSNQRYYTEAQLAALDQRDDDVIEALTKGIDQGMRWHYLFQLPIFEDLRGNPAFQAQASRFADLIATETAQIRAMLCGPDKTLTSWEPAPETCL